MADGDHEAELERLAMRADRRAAHARQHAATACAEAGRAAVNGDREAERRYHLEAGAH
jgi:hypothetical protein